MTLKTGCLIMKMILLLCAAVGIIVYIILMTVNTVKKSKTIKSMQKSMESLKYGALDSALKREGAVPRTIIRIMPPDNRALYFEKDQRISFGRLHSNSVCIDHNSVSKEHCYIFSMNDRIFIQDLNSSNFTVIIRYGEKRVLSAGEKMEVQSGDTIMLGNVSVKIQLFYCIEA